MNWLVSMKRSTQFTKQASARLSNFGPGLSMHFSFTCLHGGTGTTTHCLWDRPFSLVVTIVFSIVDFSFSFVSYSKVGVLTGVPLGFPEGPVFIGLHNSNYLSSKVQSASAFNTGSPLHNLLLLESPSASCQQRKTGKIACLYSLLFFSPNPWDLCLALPHRMLTINRNSQHTPSQVHHFFLDFSCKLQQHQTLFQNNAS